MYGTYTEVYVNSALGTKTATLGNYTNSGNINIDASAGSATGNNAQVGISDIVGAVFSLGGYAQTINNQGNVSIKVTGDKGSTVNSVGAFLLENANGSTLNNTGKTSLNITATTANDIYGIYVKDSKNVTISNPEPIYFELSVQNLGSVRTLKIENSSVKLQGDFSLVFGSPGIDPSPDSNTNLDKRPIYVGPNSTLDLNNATLVVYKDSRNLKFNTPYYLIHNDGGTVLGQFGGLKKTWTNPEIVVKWVGPDNGEHAAVIFTYEPVPTNTTNTTPMVSPSFATTVGYVGSSIISQVFGKTILGYTPGGLPFCMPREDVSQSSKDPLRTTCDRNVFVLPLYTKLDADDLGFDAYAYGLALGVGGKITEKLAAGVFAGYSKADLYFKVNGPQKEYQSIYFGGLALSYTPKPWYARFTAIAHRANHDYRGFTGLYYELYEHANYKSWGFDTELAGGYVFNKEKYTIAPEIGLAYTYYTSDDFHTEVPANPAWNRYYKTDSVGFVKGLVGLYGATTSKMGNTKTILYGHVRLEQAFGGNRLSAISYMQDSPEYRLSKKIGKTTLIGDIGVRFELRKGAELELSFRGDLNADYRAYMTKAALRYYF
ncbi:autotransporter outer membrane beta-barrel domain-containing protein [Thermocrinis minervae]|uniref:Autotransporter beta-domain-containing protein n=1 Tax=Thermocrinis minervae TaxID=381751 RepID=A0A1M6Q8W7_9AQUI|nr:autotransporter outer membrane beta-barrel domain-containing protein [Thermocrinis minervae]SHK16575.1 Autotransporter beta-domain-containing protein [Thermocrinis minervae]